jgi:hypothetical protein
MSMQHCVIEHSTGLQCDLSLQTYFVMSICIHGYFLGSNSVLKINRIYL